MPSTSGARHVPMPFGAMPEPDVVNALVEQHMLIRDLMAQVLLGPADERQETFHHLVTLLSVHETAEEEVVHPAARQVADHQTGVVQDRLQEEHTAKEMLEELDGMAVDDPRFEGLFRRLRAAVLTHAVSEQHYEFNRLRQHLPDEERATMRMLVAAAERTAPTHPHAGVESATANLIVGPMAAVVDRVRDAIREARKEA